MRRPALFAIALALLGCHEPVTQIVVVVDSDLEPALRASVRAEIDSGARVQALETAAEVPFSFGVRDRAGAASVEVTVDARDASGGTVVRRLAVLPFTRGETRRATIRLDASCRFVWATCAEGRTCRAGVCSDVATEALDPIVPGAELDDAGP